MGTCHFIFRLGFIVSTVPGNEKDAGRHLLHLSHARPAWSFPAAGLEEAASGDRSSAFIVEITGCPYGKGKKQRCVESKIRPLRL
jgi:hypothetical protein